MVAGHDHGRHTGERPPAGCLPVGQVVDVDRRRGQTRATSPCPSITQSARSRLQSILAPPGGRTILYYKVDSAKPRAPEPPPHHLTTRPVEPTGTSEAPCRHRRIDIEANQFADHREGEIKFQRLLKGDPDQPNNFEWSLVRTGEDYVTPRHHHNFSQSAPGPRGHPRVGPRQADPHRAAVAYFPEGTFYGPQQGHGGLLLGLQYGEASGSGFMSYDRLAEGNSSSPRVRAASRAASTATSTTPGSATTRTATRRSGRRCTGAR